MAVDPEERQERDAAVKRGDQVVAGTGLRVHRRGVRESELKARQLTSQFRSREQDAHRERERQTDGGLTDCHDAQR